MATFRTYVCTDCHSEYAFPDTTGLKECNECHALCREKEDVKLHPGVDMFP